MGEMGHKSPRINPESVGMILGPFIVLGTLGLLPSSVGLSFLPAAATALIRFVLPLNHTAA